jgi:hypothetical protein
MAPESKRLSTRRRSTALRPSCMYATPWDRVSRSVLSWTHHNLVPVRMWYRSCNCSLRWYRTDLVTI